MNPNITYYESQDDWLADKNGCGATTAYKLLAACPSSCMSERVTSRVDCCSAPSWF